MSNAPPPGLRKGRPRVLDEFDVAELVEIYSSGFNGWKQLHRQWTAQHPDKPVSIQTLRTRVQEAMEEAELRIRSNVGAMRLRQEGQIDTLMRIAIGIAASSKCSLCAGEKTVPNDRLDPSQGLSVCPKCDGSGRNESDDTRLRAITTIKQLLETKAKLWGLNAPEQSEVRSTVSIQALDIAGLSDQALEAELAQHFAPGGVDLPALRSASDEGDGSPALDPSVRSADDDDDPGELVTATVVQPPAQQNPQVPSPQGEPGT